MTKRINIDEADEKVKKFLKGFDVKKDRYVLEIGGEPFIALISPDELDERACLREYSAREIKEFLREDVLDDRTLARARQLLGQAS